MKIENLNIATPEEELLARWREAIEKNNGRVWILIHPYYGEGRDQMYYYPQYVRFKRLFEDFIKTNREPLIILEEYCETDTTRLRMMRLTQNEILFIPTERANPRPMDYSVRRDTWEERYQAKWQRLAEVFGMMGVKEIIVAGGLLTADKECMQRWKENLLGGCLGEGAAWLSESFPVTFSGLSYPLVQEGKVLRLGR